MLSLQKIIKIPHIVLADGDDNECLLFIKALLNLEVPYILSVARNGEMLLNMLDERDFNPDFIFLDLQTSGISSEKYLEAIKNKKKTDSIPVILYSGSDDPDDKDYCYNTRANEYFLKALFFLL